VHDLERVVEVDELEARVAAEHGGHDGTGEVAGERGVGGGADERREPQDRGGHVGPAAAEPAHVALDVEDVAGESAARHLTRLGLFGEDGRVAEGRPVRGGGGTHDQLAQPRRLLARGEQLHGADDVGLLHGRTPAVPRVGRGHERHMGDGVGVQVGDDSGDGTGVRTHLFDTVEERGDLGGRLVDVEPDDAPDAAVGREPGGHVRAEVAADPGDHHGGRVGRVRLGTRLGAHHDGSPRGTDRWPDRRRPDGQSLAETATLDAGLAQQLAVFLLGHTLAALLDHRAHTRTFPLRFTELDSGRRPAHGRMRAPWPGPGRRSA
jgi:hypothetical protein